MLEFTLLQLLLLIAVIALSGVVFGYLIVGIRAGNGSSKKQDEKVQQLEEEIAALEEYKSQVSGHFQKTAGLLHDMTGQYKTIYEHMAEGAQTLCDDQESGAVLESLQTGLLTKDNLTEFTQTSGETDNEEN